MKEMEDIHYDILETYYAQEDFKKLEELKGDLCLKLDEILKHEIHNLIDKYSTEEVKDAIDFLIKKGYLKKNKDMYCLIKQAFRSNLEETY